MTDASPEAVSSPMPSGLGPPPSPMVSSVAPYHLPPTYPPPVYQQSVATDGRAATSLVFAILGLLLGLPLGVPGLIAGPIAYFLGKSARERISASNGSIGGAGAANAGRILGVVTTAVGAVVSLIWLIVILNALNDASTSTGF